MTPIIFAKVGGALLLGSALQLGTIRYIYWEPSWPNGYDARFMCGRSRVQSRPDPRDLSLALNYTSDPWLVYQRPWYVLTCLWEMHIKNPLLFIEKSSCVYGGSGFLSSDGDPTGNKSIRLSWAIPARGVNIGSPCSPITFIGQDE